MGRSVAATVNVIIISSSSESLPKCTTISKKKTSSSLIPTCNTRSMHYYYSTHVSLENIHKEKRSINAFFCLFLPILEFVMLD